MAVRQRYGVTSKTFQKNLLASVEIRVDFLPDEFGLTHVLLNLIRNRGLAGGFGGALAILFGLAMLWLPLGESLVNRSYDWAFRFASRAVTNQVVLIEMDSAAHAELHQTRDQKWDRRLHVGLLNYLHKEACPLVVFDVWFGEAFDPQVDSALANAIQNQGRVALIAKLADPAHPRMVGNQVYPPLLLFREAAASWGVAQATWESDQVVRKPWVHADPNLFPSLPSVVARMAGTTFEASEQSTSALEARWIRYYGSRGPWTRLSYHFATNQAPGFYRDKIVFVGSHPSTPIPGDEKDEFQTPFTSWTHQSVGGLEIMATITLNLINHEWLRRLPSWIEVLIVVLCGASIGFGFGKLRWHMTWALGIPLALGIGLYSICLSHFSNVWFPWLVVAAGQIPVTAAWFSFLGIVAARAPDSTIEKTIVAASPAPRSIPFTPDYERVEPPFGGGAYGQVWLVRNAVGEWQALKVIFRSKFSEPEPYDREFVGIRHYKPISNGHPGLLRIDFVSAKQPEGYFYYVMELGDSIHDGWQEDPSRYQALNLENKRAHMEGRRLPISECLSIGISLADTIDYLHQHKLIHRDIKPSNVIFVKGKPKLADVGLVTEISHSGHDVSLVGTYAYMPPEGPGKPQADIYALGMVLYSISTGGKPSPTLDLSESLLESSPEFMLLNKILWKACAPLPQDRYATAAEMRDALQQAAQQLP